MKYVASLVLGIFIGAALFALALFYNPFQGRETVSPLAVTDDRVVEMSFSAVPGDAVLYTDNGRSNIAPHPDRVAELWEPAVKDTRLRVVMLEQSRGGIAGLGIKFLSSSESTALLSGEAIANSVWHVYLPGQGTFMVDQTENYWTYLRDVVIPAYWSSGDNWRGSYHNVTTNGPRSLGTARVTGGSGVFSGLTSESMESLTARGYSAVAGPVSMMGSLAIALPQQTMADQ